MPNQIPESAKSKKRNFQTLESQQAAFNKNNNIKEFKVIEEKNKFMKLDDGSIKRKIPAFLNSS